LTENKNKLTENYVEKILVKNVVISGGFSIFGMFSYLRSCSFVLSIFLSMLVGNNIKMTANDVDMVWVQKQVIMC